jgi:uroporphyrinogen-III decarboxylase
MTPKDRVIAALSHQEPDRVPTGENQVDGAMVDRILGRHTLYNAGWEEVEALWSGKRDEIVRDYCDVHVELPRALDWDFVRVPVVPATGHYQRPEMTGPYSWIDESGHEVTFNPEVGNISVRHTFSDMSIDDLPSPDEDFEIDPSQLDAIRHVVSELGKTHFVIARSPVDGTFPWAHTVGMDEFLVRMITDPEFVRRAADAYVARSIAYINAFFDAGVHGVMVTDDYSDNRGPIMGLTRFREFILPGLRRQCEAVHARGGHFIKHTDGNTWDMLPDFVEAGIDGWHGIQPAIGMDLQTLKERFGVDLCLFGGVDCETLIEGPPDRARDQVRYAVEHAAPGGGLVIATSNVLQPGTQFENYQAMRQAVRDFGEYPIGI